MPCNDCSRTEQCPPCPNEPKGYGDSSSELFAPGAEAYYRKVLKLDEPEECQHPNKPRTGAADDAPVRKTFLFYTCPDCKANVMEAEQEPPEPEEEHDFSSPCHCAACMRAWIGPHAVLEEDPPLTPEEEQAPEDAVQPCARREGCTNPLSVACAHGCRWAADELSREEGEDRPTCGSCGYDPQLATEHRPDCTVFPATPPQPERRPPYAVAYSVQGHLFEVALPGDATVRAVDGALVISHHLGPVAGIVQVLPMLDKESP